jgi:thymidylate synthase (FAD)
MKAEYIEHMGSDISVVNSARVSFDKQSEFEYSADESGNVITSLNEKDVKLIRYLASHNHWTPFSHPQITVRETVPIFVARQRFKHMVGFTYNEVSRRYVDDAPSFYAPIEWRSRPDKSIKQGSGGTHPENLKYRKWYEEFISQAELLYNTMIAEGVAPEQARMVLPQSMYTSYYVTGSLAAWARAYSQRIDVKGGAQAEIAELASIWDKIIQPLFPVSWEHLTRK